MVKCVTNELAIVEDEMKLDGVLVGAFINYVSTFLGVFFDPPLPYSSLFSVMKVSKIYNFLTPSSLQVLT